MPFMPFESRQFRGANPSQQWLSQLRSQLRSGSRVTAPLPLLDATNSFTERIGAPGRNWQDYNARARSGSYINTPGVGPTQLSTSGVSAPRPLTSSQRIPAVRSTIAALRPRGGGGVTPGPDFEYIYGATGGGPGAPPAPPDRSDVGDGGGFFSGVGDYLGGPGMGQAMIGAGGAMMEAAGQPGATFGGSLGTGLRGFAAERARYGASEAARQQAAQAGQTPLQDLTARQNALLARLALRGIDDPMTVQRYMAMAADEEGYKAALVELEAPEAAEPTEPTDLEKEQEKLAWYLNLPPEDRESYNLMRRNPPAGTTVNIEGDEAETPVSPAQAGMDTYIQDVYNGRSTTFNDVIPSLQNVDQTLKLVNHDRFNEVAGFWSGNPIADALLRYEGDPELLAMLGTFERLGSDRALAILRNFTGAKSNFEFQVSEKMAAKDRSMTPAELRAMLELMRRAHIQEAVRWAQSMVFMGEDVQIQGDYAPIQARFMSDAQGILDEYGAEERSWRQNVDPFGIGF